MVFLLIIIIFLFSCLLLVGLSILKCLKKNSCDIIPELLKSELLLRAYDDGISLPVKETGGLLYDFVKGVRLILFPLQFAAAYQDNLKNFLDTTIRKIAPENRIPPPKEIVTPILQYIRSQDNKILKDFFSNLLAAAMDKTRVSDAHPGFAFVACQLSPDEALIIKHFSNGSFNYKVQWDLITPKKISNYRTIENEFPANTLVFPENFGMYLEHLYHLCIAKCYNNFTPLREDKHDPRRQTGGIDEYTAVLTEFGNKFIKACVYDPKTDLRQPVVLQDDSHLPNTQKLL